MAYFDDLLEEEPVTAPRKRRGYFDDLLEEEEEVEQPIQPAQPVRKPFDEKRFFLQEQIQPTDQVEKKPQDNIFRQALDIPVNIGRGGVQGIKMMTDLLGADNPISKSLSGVEGYLADMLSAQANDDQEEIARILKDAEDKGFGEQVMAGIKAFSIAPVDIMSQAMGTMIPVVATGLAGSAAKLGAVGIRAVQTGVGAGMGAGMTKGNIYSEVKQELVNSGIDEQEAEKAAVEAQSYGGKNLDQILLGAGLGAASTLGAESILTRILTKQGKEATAGAVTRALKGGITEALPEAAQAAQEQLATNIALQREGFDVPTTRGVVSAAAMEGIAGAAIGAPVGALERPTQLKLKTPAEENLEQTTDIARKVAESGAPATASVLQDQAAENVRQEELAKQLATELETEELTQPPAAPTERATEAPSATTTPLTTAVTEQIVPTPAQPPPTDATQEIIQQESLRAEPQDRVEGRTPEGAIVSDSIPTPEGGEAQRQVINDLRSVADNTANREQISALSEAGLVDIIKGQPVINEDGEAILAQARAPLPRLTPEERVAEIQAAPFEEAPTAPAAEAPAIVEQSPVISEEGVQVSDITPEPTISESPFTETTGDAEIDAKITRTETMSPDEYLQQAWEATDGKLGVSYDEWLASNKLTDSDRAKYAQAMMAGEKFPLPYIDKYGGSQDGRNRALAAKEAGIQNIPVGIVEEPSVDVQIQDLRQELSSTKSKIGKARIQEKINKLLAEQTAPEPTISEITQTSEMIGAEPTQPAPAEGVAEPSRAVTPAPETAAAPAVVPEREGAPAERTATLEEIEKEDPVLAKKIKAQRKKEFEGSLKTQQEINARSFQAVTPEGTPFNIQGTKFVTERGSQYTFDGQKSQRYKAQREMEREAGEQYGLKEPSDVTYFVSPEGATEIGMWQTLKAPGKRILVEGNQLVLLSFNQFTNKWGSNGRIPIVSNTPQVGLSPIELFAKDNQGMYLGNHPGNKIVSISGKEAKVQSLGNRMLNAINEQIAAGNEVFMAAENESAKVNKEIVDKWNKEGKQLFKIDKNGDLSINSNGKYRKLTKGDMSLVAFFTESGPLPASSTTAPTAPTPEAVPAPEAPAEIAVGSRVRKTKGGRIAPNTYIIQEVLPQTEAEIRNNEQSYLALNEQTGNVEDLNTNDGPVLVKGKGARRMAAEGRAEKVAPVPKANRYTIKSAIIETNKLFGGEVPPNFAIITDPTNKEFEFKAAYDPNNGMVILNLAYIRNTDNLQDIISHELGHYLYGDPKFQSAFEGFWNAMTPEQQALGDEIIRSSYNKNTGQIQMEEKQVRAFMSLIEEANAQPQWRKVLDAIKRWFNRVFGTEFQTTDRGALDVLAAGVKRFGSGEQIIRAEAQEVFRMAADTEAQRQEQLFGNKSVGDILDTPAGFFNSTDEIIRKDYFNAGIVSDENTERAFGLLEALTDPQDGANYAKSIVADVAAKMPEVENAMLKSVAVVRIQNELFRYAIKLAIKGDQRLRKLIYLRANKMPTGMDETVSQAGRTLSARQRILDPTIAALDMIQASDIEQVAAFVFGTKNPTKEQVQAVADALRVVDDTKITDESDILDGLTDVGNRVNINLTSKIDKKIEKAGKKKKKVKDVVDSTDTGKEQFAEMSEEEAAAAIKRKAQEAISRKADNVIESLARTQADVYVWPQQRTNEVRTIVQQDLRQRPDMGRKEPWMNMLTGKLTQAGVSDTQAQTIAELVWRQHEINSMNREIAEMEKAAEFGSLGGIIQRIKDTPLIQQQGPDWREGVIRDYLREAGLSTKAAETAARLYNSIIIDRLAKAQQKAFEDTLNKSAPWKNYFARNARLAKGALEKIRLAVRTGALDPSRNLENVIAEQNGWTGFTDKQFQRLAELDEIISDPNVDDVTRTESIVEINKIVADAKLPVRLRDSLGAYYTGQALMGIPTALVNIASPIGFSIRNLFTDIARYSTSDPKNIPIAFETFMESMRTWYDQVSYAFRTQIYRNDVVEYLAGNNTLRELFNKGKKQWENGEYGKGFLNMSVGMAQITGRVLSSLDQGAITSLESQNITRYALEAMKMTSIPKDEQKLFARKVLEARRKTKAQLVSEGMNADRAGVLADLEVRSLVMTELSRLNVPFTEVLESSINDALLSVGRNREITITGLDAENKRLSDKGLISYYPIHFLEQMAESAARSSPGMQVFSRMLYGFALVPARVFHNVAWYSPYGFFRIWREKEAGKHGWEKRYEMSLGNELQYRQRLTDAIAGSIVMLGLAALASGSTDDEDEDKAFRIVITGNGPDAATDRQFHDAWMKKWKPYSVHIVVNGTIIPINIGRGGEALFFPIMLAGALDDWKIKGKLNQARKSPEELNQAIEMGSSAFFALAQRGPFAAFTKPLFDASKEGRAAEELVGQLGFFGKTFIPGIGASVFRNISDMINDPVDRSSVTGSIYANTPMVGPLMGSKSLNALGQPTRADDWSDRLFRLGVPVVFSFPKDAPENELNELILQKGSGPSFPTRRVAQAAVGRPLSDQEFETYVREYGRVMSDKMFKNRKRLENMPVQQYDRELERYAQGFSIDGIPISGARDAAVRAVNRMAQ